MIKPDDVKWGSYDVFEGPYYPGSKKFSAVETDDETQKQLAVITAVESGHYDAINCYDSAIVSVGLIQWTEAKQYTVSGMLGEVAERNGPQSVLGPLALALRASNATFRKNAKAQWRFHFLDGRGEVDNLKEQQDLFLKCDGRKGSWTPEATAHAKLWAACLANVWDSIGAQKAQVTYTRFRLKWFIDAYATPIINDGTDDLGWRGALRAAYISFAVNNPTRASNMLKAAVESSTAEKWSERWCIEVLQKLTFGPKIKFYPIRYNAIRPVIERFWDVEMPKTAEDLASWKPAELVPLPVEPAPPEHDVDDEDRITVPDRPSNLSVPNVDIFDVPPPKQTSPLGFILSLLQKIFSAISRSKNG